MAKMNPVFSALACVLAAASIQASSAFAGPCNPSFGPANLRGDELARYNRDGMVRHDDPVGDYFVSYVVADAPYDAELAMGVYLSCGEHAGGDGLGDFINVSEMRSPEGSNPFQVYYEQAGSWGFSGGEYTVENTVRAIPGGYIMRSRLIDSSDAHFSPKTSDGYVRMVRNGSNSILVVACNYMVPKSPPIFSRGKYNGMAKERLEFSAKNLMKWVGRVSEDSDRAQSYRDKLKRLLGQ